LSEFARRLSAAFGGILKIARHMNTDFLLFNLLEAQKEIEKTIRDLETDSDYGEPEFSVAMMHLYHHVNTAWNARDSTPEQSKACSDEDFNRWGRYPTDLIEMLV
jgi:hypothetical protein